MNNFWRIIIGISLLFNSMVSNAISGDSEIRKHLEAAHKAQDEQRHEDAIKYFEHAFASGSYSAFVVLVKYYQSAEYRNEARLNALIKQMEQASEQGNADASYIATELFSAQQFTNPQKAFRHNQLLIMNSLKNSSKWLDAHMRQASYYLTGRGVEKDIESGLNTLKRAATVDGVVNSQVHMQLGYLYQQLGDKTQAAKWYDSGIRGAADYQKNAKLLITTIYYELGLIDETLASAAGVHSNQALTAIELDDLTTFAHDGDHRAQLALAHSYGYGQLVAQNSALAHRFFQMAIADDDLASLKAYINWLDYHVDKSSAASFPYVLRAAKKNDPNYTAQVADHYLKGIGTAKNPSAAKDWAKRAIQLGNDNGELVLLPAFIDLNPPNSSGWQFLTDTKKGGKAYTASGATYGPLQHNGQRIVYALNLIKYNATQTEHEDDDIVERRYTSLVDAYKINCSTQQGQLLGYALFDGNTNVYELIDLDRWGDNTFISASIGALLVKRLCN